MLDMAQLTDDASQGLSAVANPAKAAPMAAYMKTEMPFYGVQKSGRTPVLRSILADHPPASADDYRSAVLALWNLDHREEKYLALGYARHFDDLVRIGQLDLYRWLIVDGAWWDFVDETAIKLVGRVLTVDRPQTTKTIRGWNDSEDVWLRRTSIICQVGRKAETDEELLFEMCTPRLAEREFFIRKAVGWALRDYSKTEPESVRQYVDRHREAMSGLTLREASKYT